MTARIQTLPSIFRIPIPGKRTALKLLAVSLLIFVTYYSELFALLYSLYRIEFHNNFYEVVPGVLYRSGEMPPAALGEIIGKYGIASVLDLRISGETIHKDGVSEKQIVLSHGARYVNFPVATSRVPTKEDLLRLDGILHSLQTPLLIHCSTGALRTGVITTLWLQEVADLAPELARTQLAAPFGYSFLEYVYKEWSNGHPPLPFLLYEYGTTNGHHASGENLHSWLERGRSVPDEGGKLTFLPEATPE
jgi:hypothetical protein